MTAQRWTSRILKYGVNPKLRRPAIDFKSQINRIYSVVILLPPGKNQETITLARQLVDLFPESKTRILNPESITLSQHPLWAIMKSPEIRTLCSSRIDLLIDLNPAYNPVGYYLAQKMSPKISIGNNKTDAALFYNLIYQGQPSPGSFSGLPEFIQSMRKPA